MGGPVATGDTVPKTSSTTPIVTVEVDAARQTEIHDGDTVTISMPDNTTADGVVSTVGSVATTNDEDDTVIEVA